MPVRFITTANKSDTLIPRWLRNPGVAIVHQELNLCPHLTVAENIFLGRERTSSGVVVRQRNEQSDSGTPGKMDLDLRPDTIVGDLSVSKQQMVGDSQGKIHQRQNPYYG